nr:unnamed protein product [uncultured bacterium]
MSDDRRLGTRVNLTLPDDVIRALDAMSEATDTPRATVVRGWLEMAVPVMQATAEAIIQSKRDEAEGMKKMAAILKESSTVAEQMSLDIKSQRRKNMRKKRGRAT